MKGEKTHFFTSHSIFTTHQDIGILDDHSSIGFEPVAGTSV